MNRAPKRRWARHVRAPINDASEEEEKQKTYELDATVLDEYAASVLPMLPGLHMRPKILTKLPDDIFFDPLDDNHPFQRRLDNAASAPAAAEATYWLMLYTHRRFIMVTKKLSAIATADGDMEQAQEYDRMRDPKHCLCNWLMAPIVEKDTPAMRAWRVRHNHAIEEAAAAFKQQAAARDRALARWAAAAAMNAITDAIIADAIADATADAGDDDAGLAAAMMEVNLADFTADATPTPDAAADLDIGMAYDAPAVPTATAGAIADAPTAADDANDKEDEAPQQGPRPKPVSWFKPASAPAPAGDDDDDTTAASTAVSTATADAPAADALTTDATAASTADAPPNGGFLVAEIDQLEQQQKDAYRRLVRSRWAARMAPGLAKARLARERKQATEIEQLEKDVFYNDGEADTADADALTADVTADATADANTSGSARPERCATIRDVKLYGSLIATASAKPDIIMRGNGQMTKKDKLSIAEKAKLVLWFGLSAEESWTDEDWALTDNHIYVVMRKKAPREQSVFSGFCTLMLADPALHDGRTTLYVKDLLTQPTGLAEVKDFLPLLQLKVKERLPLAQRIAIVTNQENLSRACGNLGYKEKKTYKQRIINNYFDGQNEHTKWKVWLIDLA